MKVQSITDKKQLKGFSLVEIMVSVLLIGLIISGAIFVILQAYVAIQVSKQKVRASTLMNEQYNIVMQNAKSNWKFISDNTTGTFNNLVFSNTTELTGTTSVNNSTTITGISTFFTKELNVGDSIALSSNSASFVTISSIASDTSLVVSAAVGNGSGGQKILKLQNSYLSTSGYTTINDEGTSYQVGYKIENAYRDVSGNLTITNTGYPEYHYRYLTTTALWRDLTGRPQSVTTSSYISDNDSNTLLVTTFYDFRRGTSFTSTYVTDSEGGSRSGELSLSPSTSGGNYQLSGNYISQIFDSSSSSSNYYSIEVIADLPVFGVTNFSIDFRAADSISDINNDVVAFQSTTCTQIPPASGSIYTYECDLSSYSAFKNKKYFEYRINLSTNGANITQTPKIRDVKVYYQ